MPETFTEEDFAAPATGLRFTESDFTAPVKDPAREAKGRALRGEQMAERRSGYGADALVAGAGALESTADLVSKANPLTAIPRAGYAVSEMLNPTGRPFVDRPTIEKWTPEMARTVRRAIGGPGSTDISGDETAAGVANAVSDFGEFFTTPEGIATLGAGAAPALARAALGAGFAGQMSSHLPEAAAQAGELSAGDDRAEAVRAGLGALNTAVFAGAIPIGAIAHGRTPRVLTPAERVSKWLDGREVIINEQTGTTEFGPLANELAIVRSAPETAQRRVVSGQRPAPEMFTAADFNPFDRFDKPPSPATPPTTAAPVATAEAATPGAPTTKPAPISSSLVVEPIEFSPFDTAGSDPAARTRVREDNRSEWQDPLAPKPEPAATTAFDPAAVQTVEFPLAKLKLSKDVPNFKGGAREDTGTVAGQELAGKYQRTGTAPIVVWERLNGDTEVITGRHRFDLARRTGEKTIPAQVVREADGFTKDQALTFDAEANIRDGQGEVADYATYFKGIAITEAEARSRGLLSRAKGNAGWSLAKAATDDVYALWRADKLTDAQAVAIARAAPGDAGAQQIGSKFALQGKGPDFLTNVIKASKAEAGQRAESLDLFGKDDSAMQTMAEQAERASQFQKDIVEQIRAVQGAAKRPEAARKLGVDVKDPEGVVKRIAALKAELAQWENWPMQPELVAKVRGVDSGASLSVVRAREKLLKDYQRGAYKDSTIVTPEEAATGDMMDTLRVPNGWSVKETIPSKWGSAYWELIDVDGDGWKVSVRDHSPSPIREQEFGASHLSAYVEDAKLPSLFAEGMTKLEAKLQEAAARLPEIKRAEAEAASKAARDREAVAQEKQSVEYLTRDLVEREDLFARGLRSGNGKPFTTENQREIARAAIAKKRAELEAAKAKARQGEKSLAGDSQASVLGSGSTKTGAQTESASPAAVKPPDFSLAAAESVPEQQARLAQEQAQREAKAQQDKLAELQAKPLQGTAGDLGQGDMFAGPQDLFAPPSPKSNLNSGALGESGMGGAKPGEFAGNSGTPTGIKNATVDAERARRGLPPAMEAARRDWGSVWDEAMARVDTDPALQDRLIAELKAKPRALTDTEDAMLLHRQIDLQNEYGRATRDMAQAYEDSKTFPNRLEEVEAGKIRTAELSDRLLELYDVNKAAGTETGRGLAARKMMAYEDFSLAQMELAERASRGGAPLTDAERAKLVEQQKRIAELEATAQKVKEQADQERATRMTDEAIADMKRELASKPSYDPRIVKIAEEIVGKLEQQAEKSRAFLKGKFLSPTPEDIYHLGVIGAAKIARLGLDFSKFSIEMAAEFGDGVKPYLQAAWDRANLHIENEGAKYGDKAEPVKRLLRKRDAAGRREGIVEGLKKAKEEGLPLGLQGDYIRKLALSFVRGGLSEREALVDAVHKVLTEEIGLELSRRETMDAISGYGSFKPLDMDAAKATLRDLKGQMQQVAKLEDITAKKPLQKTGVERRTQSDEERRLIQQVNEAKRRHGVVVTDPARQLKSALAARVTALKHRKADLEYQLSTRERIVKTKTPTPFDAETQLLEVQVEQLARQLDELVPKPGVTDEQRSAMAERSVERDIAVLEEQIKAGDVKAKAGRPIMSTPKLEALKARRDALRAERQELRELDGEFQRQKAEKALTQQKASLEAGIAAREKALAEGPKPPVGREVSRPADPALESLMQKRDALNRQLAEARKKPWEQKHAEAVARQLAAMEQSIATREAKLAAGDLSTESRAKVARPLADPELEMARQRLDDVNRRLAEARNPKKSPEERANAAAYTRLTNLAAQYADRLAREDFAPRVRKPLVMDAKTLAAQADAARAKQAFTKGLALNRAKNRTRTEKVLDAAVAWNRFSILSSPAVFMKLGTAAAWRMASTPVLEGIGSGIGAVLPGLAARAPRHGAGLNLRTEVKALTEGIVAGMSDAAKMMRTGETDLDVLYGKFRDAAGTGETTKLPPTWLDFWGHLHGAMKTFPKRAEFTRSLEKNLAWEASQGADVTQPGVQMRAALRAYKDAERAIFMQDNRVVGAYKAALRWMDQKDKATGETPLRWQLAGMGARLALPIVKVPSNIAGEILEHVVGLATGSKGAAKAYRKGLESVGPEEADAVLRQLKNGSLGGAMLLLGFYTGAQYLGGMHVHNEKRDKADIKPNAGRVPGVAVPPWLGGPDIPKNAMHFPLISVAQMGATVARVSDAKLHKRDAEAQGVGAGAIAAALGLAEEVPFMRESAMVANLREPGAGARYVGDKARSILIPQLVQWTARQMDSNDQWETTRRAPQTAADHIKLGIPYMRNSVPEKVEKRGR